MALLADDTLRHPPLEILITTDEETGMYGAKALDASILKGRRLINVDSEDEGVVLVSCAGGLRVNASLPAQRITAEGTLLKIELGGLAGGHSGAEIHRYHVNAVYELARLLFDLRKSFDFLLVEMTALRIRGAPKRTFRPRAGSEAFGYGERVCAGAGAQPGLV